MERSMETASPGFRELQERIEQWGWFGYDRDPREAQLAAYANLTFGDVERFFLDHVEGRPVTLMVVGDPRRVNVKKLGKYGKVVRLKQRALFAR